MTKIREWWKSIGWPWLKSNWWVVLLLPVVAVVATAWVMSKYLRPSVTILNPTQAADERAKIETETRFKQVAAEKQRLSLELIKIQKKYDDLLAEFDSRLEHRIDELRNNPEKLRQMMLNAGRQS